MDEYIIVAPTKREAVYCFRYAREILRPIIWKWSSNRTIYVLQFKNCILKFTTEFIYETRCRPGSRAKPINSSYFETWLDEYKEKE